MIKLSTVTLCLSASLQSARWTVEYPYAFLSTHERSALSKLLYCHSCRRMRCLNMCQEDYTFEVLPKKVASASDRMRLICKWYLKQACQEKNTTHQTADRTLSFV